MTDIAKAMRAAREAAYLLLHKVLPGPADFQALNWIADGVDGGPTLFADEQLVAAGIAYGRAEALRSQANEGPVGADREGLEADVETLRLVLGSIGCYECGGQYERPELITLLSRIAAALGVKEPK